MDNKMTEAYEIKDEELEMVSGGNDIQYMRIACPHCGKINNVNVMANAYKCDHCKISNTISG